MITPPQKEHEWLNQLLGDWTYESEFSMGPDQPPGKSQGTESFRSLGGLWVIGEGQGEMPDGNTGKMILTIGYDPAKGHYVGTWIGSMMNLLWIYEGRLDDTGKVLTLAAEGPNFADGGKTRAMFHDIITIISPDHRTLTSEMQGEDGQWTRFMTAHYRRAKA